MNKKWLMYLVGLGVGIAVFIATIARAEVPSTYTIQPGDTLSKIALRFYGNEAGWKAIYEINPQLGNNPDLIYPGWLITLDPNIKISPKGKQVREIPRVDPEVAYDKLIRHVFKVNRQEYVSREDLAEKILNEKYMMFAYGTRSIHSQRTSIHNLTKYFRQMEYYNILDGVFDACQFDTDYTMTALLMAMLWQESDYNNVRGKHQEVTPYQFLPSTLKHVLQLDNVETEIIMDTLMDNPTGAATLAYEWLYNNGMNKKNFRRALSWWNSNPKYPGAVIWKYGRIVNILVK